MTLKGIGWLAAAAVAVSLAGCGGGDDSNTVAEVPGPPPKLQLVPVTLNGYEGPEHVGILMAQAYGYFAEVGLEVTPGSPGTPVFPVRYLLGEVSDFAISHLPQVAIAQDNGKPIVAIGSLISQPTAAMIWLKGSGIDRISDLKGKTVAIPGLPFQKALLQSALSRAGLQLSDLKLRPVEYRAVSELSSGRVDAIFGGSANVEGEELRSQGLNPVITPVQDLGVPPYDELVLIVRRDRLAREPQMVRGFLRALYRGTAVAVANPQRAAELLENGIEPNPDSTRQGMKTGVESTVPLLSGSGAMDHAQAKRLVDWMYGEGMIHGKLPVSSLLTNKYLPQFSEEGSGG